MRRVSFARIAWLGPLALAWLHGCASEVEVRTSASSGGGSPEISSSATNVLDGDFATSSTGGPVCGNGIVEPGEECDAGAANGGACSTSCTRTCSTKRFHDLVTENAPPTEKGAGILSKWSYLDYEGIEAGQAMCKAIGADHVCEYSELVAAEAAGELAALPKALTYWLQRTTAIADPTEPKKCNVDSECSSGFCDPTTQRCSWKAGIGANCNGWTSPSLSFADGEWFEVFDPSSPTAAGGLRQGSLVYHLDADPLYAPPGLEHLCHDSNKLGCAGPCSSVLKRALPCCDAPCDEG